jgi:two-component system, NtrC family, sensor kinase
MAEKELAQVIERLCDLGHVSSAVGHHVINAFSAIVSNAEILRLASSSAAVDPVAIADIIINEAMEASGVARRLIDLTRMATAVGVGTVALDRFIAAVVAQEKEVGRLGVSWVTALSPVPPILGHEIQLLAMTRHLLANAYESLPARGGSVTLTTSIDDRGWVTLEISDTGEGMDAETLERAVEPFFSTKPGHFGVGLTIANGIWRRHHGTLALRTQLRRGTTVRLCVEPAGERVARVGR